MSRAIAWHKSIRGSSIAQKQQEYQHGKDAAGAAAWHRSSKGSSSSVAQKQQWKHHDTEAAEAAGTEATMEAA